MKEKNQLSMHPLADARSIVQGKCYRFTVLTDRMVRMEYSPKGEFVDQATQVILNRDYPVPKFTVKERNGCLEIHTDNLIISYDKKRFSSTGLTVQMLGNPCLKKISTWFYGDNSLLRSGNLKGTASTLDNAVGNMYYRESFDDEKVIGEPDRPIALCDGVISRNGFTVIDDSASLVFTEDGWVMPAPEEHIDIYFLMYGFDYLGCMREYFHMTGHTPLLPRYVLGNWWSRYYSYTQEEYMALMDRFRAEGLPIAVAVQDMGWHLVDIDPKYGKGWTGYTWNEELFPDHRAMLKQLHEQGMHVSLNVHPADGVRAYEQMYPEMARALGIDPESEEPIPFDVTDRKFMNAYFQYLHHPTEDEGVDFWWIDWQQGSNSRSEGYDPLWMLNHYHYMDNARKGNRPLTFSRYAGLGSHRYPIGFSGSTFICWESLDFQPYFTATASNVGYGWWSHDIGGHRNGYREDELTTRWVQFGVFSPIMRLHSSNEVFTGKEPWKFCADSERVMRRFLKLRHQLVPYLYTMNYRFYREDQPLVQPMYYQHPKENEAYRVKNEYYFGTEMIVHPITSRMDEKLRVGFTKTWLPEGLWFDFFTGVAYTGGRTMELHRTIDTIPVLVKAGGVVPMQAACEIGSRTDNPRHMELCVFPGADGTFELYEDDGISMDYEAGRYVTTRYAVKWGEEKSFTIYPAEGDRTLIPQKRDYSLRLYGVQTEDVAFLRVNGEERSFAKRVCSEKNLVTVELEGIAVTDTVELIYRTNAEIAENRILELAYDAINRAQIPFVSKENLYRRLKKGGPLALMLSDIRSMVLSERMKREIEELLLARTEKCTKF
ncbi:MAG: TIM-barrel domain-containing protein [Faecousia sp.]